MKSVSRFEASLLRLLHFFLHKAPVQQALPILENRLTPPKCLSQDAVDLVKDALSKGYVLLLTRRGGWRKERFLRNEQIKEGRLWERDAPKDLGLTFSPMTLDFLMWITANDPTDEKKVWKTRLKPTLGDLVFCTLVHEAFDFHDRPNRFLEREPFRSNPLGWLCFPNSLKHIGDKAQPDFRDWVHGPGASVIEALHPMLTERWIQMEMEKGQIKSWQEMREKGDAQAKGLEAFLDAVEKANRLDLARFLLPVAKTVLTPQAEARLWVESLRQAPSKLAERSATYQAAMALVRQMPRLRRWDREARSIGYIDEGYQASQLWKADWERYQGDVLTERAVEINRQLDPMRQIEG